MSGVRSYKFITCIFLKNNCRFSCTIQEKFVPLHCDAKQTRASRNCGIAMEKIFPSARGSSAWRSGKNEERRNRF